MVIISIFFRTEQRLSHALVQIIQYLISYAWDFSFSMNLLSNFSIFLSRLFYYGLFWQLQIRFKFCDQLTGQFSWSSESDEIFTVLNNSKRYSSFEINLMSNSWKCFAFIYLHIYILWSNVWKSLNSVIYACIAFLLFISQRLCYHI